MKKVSFMLILAFASTIGVAQTESGYKLEKGNFTTELQLSLFSTQISYHYDAETDDEFVKSSPSTISMQGLRLRYALSNKWAIRATVGLDFGHNSFKSNLDDTLNYSSIRHITTGTSTNKSRYTEFSIAPGIEYHFGNWERMSVYVAGEVYFGMRTTQGTSKVDEVRKTYQQPWGGDEYSLTQTRTTTSSLTTKNCDYYSYYYPRHTRTGLITFGASAIIGMDFYVYKGLYLGAELGLGYLHASALKGTVKGKDMVFVTDQDGIDLDYTEDKVDKTFDDKIGRGNLGFRCNPTIRIGWKF